MKNYNIHLIELRRNSGLSLKDAAKKIGITRFGLFLYENGYFRPTKKSLKKIEDFYKEKISIDEVNAYPVPVKEEKGNTNKNKSLKVKRIVFGALSGYFLFNIILGVCLFNSAVNNVDSLYGETYNEMRQKVNEVGKIGHDLVTSLPYRYIDSTNEPKITTFTFYETDSLLYFNECSYSTTYLVSGFGVSRFHYQFGSNLGVNSYLCSFNFGNWSKGLYLSCNFLYENKDVSEISNLNISVNSGVEINEELVLGFINTGIKDLEFNYSKLLSDTLGRQVSFYNDFLSARETGRKVNFALQVSSLCLIIPGIIAFFIFFGIFVKSLLVNIKPRLIKTEVDHEGKKSEPLPRDLRLNFGIPDMFVVILGQVLQYGSIFFLLLSFLAKLGLPVLSFLTGDGLAQVLRICFLAGIFLQHFVMIGRIKKADVLFKTIVFNVALFLFIATFETVLISITNAWGYDFADLIYRYVPSNVYQVVAIHYLIFLFLFFQPSFIKNKTGRIIWHSLSIIPLGILIAAYFLSNAYALTYGVKENIFINFWFPNGFLPLSIVCVIFMYVTFAVRVFCDRKYGQRFAQIFFYGDRYTLYENAICAILIILVASLDFIFANNQYAYYLGLGSNYWIFALIPFILLCKYSPNNQESITIIDESNELSREIK